MGRVNSPFLGLVMRLLRFVKSVNAEIETLVCLQQIERER